MSLVDVGCANDIGTLEILGLQYVLKILGKALVLEIRIVNKLVWILGTQQLDKKFLGYLLLHTFARVSLVP